MITSIIYTYPSPTINIGGNPTPREAKICFSIGIDDNELCYQSVKLVNVQHNNWGMDDLKFIHQAIDKIISMHGKNLKDVE